MGVNFFMSKAFLSVAGSILATGALLNLAGKGTFGVTAQKMAQYVTRGYGAGNL